MKRGRCIGRLLLLLLSVPALASAQTVGISSQGTRFWCAFMENLDLSMNDAPEFVLQIEARRPVTGTVSLPATGLSVPFSAAAGTVARVALPQAIYYAMGSENVAGFGLLVEADDSVEVTALHWRLYFSESTAVLPEGELGHHYLVQSYRYANDDRSAFVVVATADSTAVTITPTVVTLNGRPAGQPFTVLLNRGQSYQVQALQDLAGTDIRSTAGRPVAVFGGARTSQVECHAANSHLYDQCLPLDRAWYWGHSFFAIPFYGQQNSVLRVLASEDETRVLFDCDTVATLQRGQTWTQIFTAPAVIYADKPIAIGQLARGVACSGAWQNGDPMLLNLLPANLRTRNSVFNVPKRASSGYSFTANIVTVVTETGRSAQIRLNDLPLTNYAQTPVGDRWEFTRIPLLPDSTYRLESDNADFQAYLHGMNYANAYAHWLSFDRVVADTSAGTAMLEAPDSVCIDSSFTVGVSAGTLHWLELHRGGTAERLTPGAAISLGQAGPVLFNAAIKLPGECQPRLVQATTVALDCPPPSDTCQVRMPDAFTPNGDQLNDLFRPVAPGCGFVEYRLTIYNRWGQLVFDRDEPGAGWDGNLSDGQAAPTDVYVYVFSYRRAVEPTVTKLQGELSLLR